MRAFKGWLPRSVGMAIAMACKVTSCSPRGPLSVARHLLSGQQSVGFYLLGTQRRARHSLRSEALFDFVSQERDPSFVCGGKASHQP
jgi:hypothetical protein